MEPTLRNGGSKVKLEFIGYVSDMGGEGMREGMLAAGTARLELSSKSRRGWVGNGHDHDSDRAGDFGV